MYKTVYVPANFAPIGHYETVQVPTGEKRKTFLSGEVDFMKEERRWVQTGYSDCAVDGPRLAQDLQAVLDVLDKGGFRVLSMTPVTSGAYQYDDHLYTAYGYGYSYTRGLVIVAVSESSNEGLLQEGGG